MSICTNNLGFYKESIENLTNAMKTEKTTKALYLRSVAYMKDELFQKAFDDIGEAINMEPNDKQLRAQHAAIKEYKKTQGVVDKKVITNFFKKGVYTEKEAPKQAQYHPYLPPYNPENSQCFFDIEIGTEGEEGYEKGRIVFEVFTKQVPKTAENFRQLCTGEQGELYHYKGSKFHRIVKDHVMQGGDTTGGTGTGGLSIYGHVFDDEGIWFPHSHKGVITTANRAANMNGSQFFICLDVNHQLNGEHTAFGRIINGYELCEKAEKVEVGTDNAPVTEVKILDCGELTGDWKLTEEQADFLATYELKEEFMKQFQENM